ncbi:MAG: hypothetical protein HDR95_08620 [Bacteroides sp.]|nr:hypothetical protein [Bacteroides sp.]
MAYEYHDIDSLRTADRPAWYVRLLLALFPRRISEAIGHAVIDLISALRIIGVYITLPFKFLQFFRQSWRNQKNKNINRDKKLKY